MNNSKDQMLSRGNKVISRTPDKEKKDRGHHIVKEPSVVSAPSVGYRPSRVAPARAVDSGTITLKGLLAAQRFTKSLKERTALKIATKKSSGSHLHKPAPVTDERVPDTSSRPQEKFSCAQAQQLVKGLLWSKLEGVSYEAKLCTRLTQELSEELKGLVKTVCPPRYKMVCVVTLGKKAREDILVASRCLWDPHADSYTSFTYESTTLFCVATVFAVYCE
ncbi:dynein light chain Tctex-type 4-like [Amia ocellicauda]|uniref:dynein light chain Tctex-type 4-like n=1 Tax=Amia ocellicauda TaxID=2972642 RepID=UPI0034643848